MFALPSVHSENETSNGSQCVWNHPRIGRKPLQNPGFFLNDLGSPEWGWGGGTEESAFYTQLVLSQWFEMHTLRKIGFKAKRREVSRCSICTENISVDGYRWKMKNRLTKSKWHYQRKQSRKQRRVAATMWHLGLQLNLHSAYSQGTPH